MTETQWMKTFGQNLKELLERSNMTEKELARRIGVSPATVNRYIHGQVMPSVKALVNIYYNLNCRYDEVFDLGDEIKLS